MSLIATCRFPVCLSVSLVEIRFAWNDWLNRCLPELFTADKVCLMSASLFACSVASRKFTLSVMVSWMLALQKISRHHQFLESLVHRLVMSLFSSLLCSSNFSQHRLFHYEINCNFFSTLHIKYIHIQISLFVSMFENIFLAKT